MTTLKGLIRVYDITATAEYGVKEYNEDMSNMDGWTVTLKFGRRRMTVPFYMGSGHNGKEPNAYDVLYCLVSDASGYDSARDFDDWASEYGYDSDSRKAERTYKQVERQAKKLRNFLGDEYETFMRAEWD